ncbi:MAG TPA: cytochrome c3 family protein [Spirochaetota bacterium]|nr:cytochrome c3 family protein [Spirochaetota bacterium]HPS87917.1 cytochrome c3 family protein [Spirochaetota bacterium]
MRIFRIITITLFFIIPVFLFAQMEIIIIDNPVFKSKSRPSVKFNHFNHMDIENVSCSDCHHRYVNGRNVIEPNELSDSSKTIDCGYCHNNGAELKNAYHRLCIRCHQAMIKKNKPAGPRLCGECHI